MEFPRYNHHPKLCPRPEEMTIRVVVVAFDYGANADQKMGEVAGTLLFFRL